jgi:fermentation-respiration switch protein FrsA (DUF1100 family)
MSGVSPRKLASPLAPTERDVHEGRPYWLWLPSKGRPPWPGMVIVHGAGSGKENHGDFGRLCAAAGWAAISYDQRGHGESEEGMSPAALADVGRMARFLASRDGVDSGRICVRGSSMGGFMALHAAATSDVISAAIAICPAGEEHLRRGLRNGDLEFRADEGERSSLEAWLGEHDLRDAVGLIGRKPLILLHAGGDEKIPSEYSAELYEAAREPRKLVLVPGGHHRSVQHDAELQAVALRWVDKELAKRGQ